MMSVNEFEVDQLIGYSAKVLRSVTGYFIGATFCNTSRRMRPVAIAVVINKASSVAPSHAAFTFAFSVPDVQHHKNR